MYSHLRKRLGGVPLPDVQGPAGEGPLRGAAGRRAEGPTRRDRRGRQIKKPIQGQAGGRRHNEVAGAQADRIVRAG